LQPEKNWSANNAKDLCGKIAQKWPEFEEFLFFSNRPTKTIDSDSKRVAKI
jgi:hypothetical protein